jgi:hypothetical protein
MQDDNPEGGVLNSVLHPSDSPELNDSVESA